MGPSCRVRIQLALVNASWALARKTLPRGSITKAAVVYSALLAAVAGFVANGLSLFLSHYPHIVLEAKIIQSAATLVAAFFGLFVYLQSRR